MCAEYGEALDVEVRHQRVVASQVVPPMVVAVFRQRVRLKDLKPNTLFMAWQASFQFGFVDALRFCQIPTNVGRSRSISTWAVLLHSEIRQTSTSLTAARQD